MSLKEVYQPYFKIGAAVGENAFGRPAALYHLRQEYDSITCENDMKPEKLLDAVHHLYQNRQTYIDAMSQSGHTDSIEKIISLIQECQK